MPGVSLVGVAARRAIAAALRPSFLVVNSELARFVVPLLCFVVAWCSIALLRDATKH